MLVKSIKLKQLIVILHFLITGGDSFAGTTPICFIKQGEKILILNRNFPEWMGVWNGVGGKINDNETPLECILREVREEYSSLTLQKKCISVGFMLFGRRYP